MSQPRPPEVRTSARSYHVALAAAVLGLAISAYLTIEHFSASTALACPENATVNCVKVTTSKWATIVGIPVAVLGLGYFAAMTVLLLAATRRGHSDRISVVLAVAAGGGVLTAIYLVYIELFKVDAICLWCTAVHMLTVVMFAALMWHATSVRPPRGRPARLVECDISIASAIDAAERAFRAEDQRGGE